jgi:cytosine/adenosine deaminase-related metal-dependent hydrolase
MGVDLETTVSGEMFTAARLSLGIQRSLDNAAHREATGGIPETSTITTREALSWVTVEGARMLGMQDHIGSLAPGKYADLVMISTEGINIQPVHNPVSSVVMQTTLANIDSVMIGGRWKKRSGRLLVPGLQEKINQLKQSGERIIRAMNLDPYSQ